MLQIWHSTRFLAERELIVWNLVQTSGSCINQTGEHFLSLAHTWFIAMTLDLACDQHLTRTTSQCKNGDHSSFHSWDTGDTVWLYVVADIWLLTLIDYTRYWHYFFSCYLCTRRACAKQFVAGAYVCACARVLFVADVMLPVTQINREYPRD